MDTVLAEMYATLNYHSLQHIKSLSSDSPITHFMVLWLEVPLKKAYSLFVKGLQNHNSVRAKD